MLPIAYYFLQVVLCSGLMMGYYLLVLRNKRFHQYNRFYLLAVALLAWIVPLIKIRWSHPVVNEGPQMMRLLSVVADNNSQIEATITRPWFQWSWEMAATGLYFVVAGTMLLGMLHAFYKIYLLLKQHSCKDVKDVYLIMTNAKGTPFSFFRYIFWNEAIDLRSESGQQILLHELEHVKQKHSVDKIMMQLMLVAGWFNPFFWLMKREMEMIHEFIADKKAVDNGDTGSLARMLLLAAYPQQRFALTNPFFFSPIRRRLQMLTNNKQPRFSYIRRIIVLPLLAMVVILFSFRNKEQRDNTTLSLSAVMENVVEAVNDLHSQEKLKDPGQQLLVDGVSVNPFNKHQTSIIESRKPISSELKNIGIKNLALTIDTDRANFLSTYNNVFMPTTRTDFSPKIKTGYPDNIIYLVDGQSVPVPQNQPLIFADNIRYALPLYSVRVTSVKRTDVHTDDNMVEKNGEEARNGIIEVVTKKKLSPVSSKDENIDQRQPDSKVMNDTAPKKIVKGVRIVSADGKWVADTQKHRVDTVGKKMVKGFKIAYINGKWVADTAIGNTASFPGGEMAWQKYLERSLNKDLITEHGGPPGKYTVVVSFKVDEQGNISDVSALNDPGYGTRDEAIRVIVKGPRWKPAIQDGHAITSTRKQSVIWVVAEETKKNNG